MRQKKPLWETIEKYIDFLNKVRTHNPGIVYYNTIQDLISEYHINKSVLIALKKLNVVKFTSDSEWEWLAGEPNKQMALEILNFCLEMNKKQIVTPITGLDAETKGYLKAIHDHLINTTSKQNNSTEVLKQGLLSRALNQSQVSAGNHLFSQVESDESKKFELLKAFAPAVYSSWIKHGNFIDEMNNTAIEITEDLFNKFFKVK